jgi:hypothetical protein
MKPDSTHPSCCVRLGTRCDPTLDSRIFETALGYRNEGKMAAASLPNKDSRLWRAIRGAGDRIAAPFTPRRGPLHATPLSGQK